MIIVDTTVWVDYFRNRVTPETDWLERELEQQPLALTDLILCEVLQGISTENEVVRTRSALERFHTYSMGGITLAIEAAGHYRSLRRQGVTVRKTIDCLIATFCLMHDHQLLHTDRDYDPFETQLGLRVIHP